jgi:hypothetical protein
VLAAYDADDREEDAASTALEYAAAALSSRLWAGVAAELIDERYDSRLADATEAAEEYWDEAALRRL